MEKQTERGREKMRIYWIVFEILLFFADILFWVAAMSYNDLQKAGKRRLKKAKTIEMQMLIEQKIDEAKLDTICWVIVAIVGMYAFADNLVNNIIR